MKTPHSPRYLVWLALCLSFLFGSATVVRAATLTWLARPNISSTRIGLAATTANGGKIYTMGGLIPGIGVVTTVQEYDPATNVWTAKANLPTNRLTMGATTGDDGLIYVAGGHIDGGGITNTVLTYDPSTNTWASRAPMLVRRNVFGLVTGANGKIYAIGGHNDSTGILASVEEYDPTSDSWNFKTSLPQARSELAAVAAANGKIYAFGGHDVTGTNVMDTVSEYDITTDTWASKSAMPIPKVNMAAAVGPDGKIYIMGGSDMQQVFDSVEVYDPATDTWEMANTLPTPLSQAGVAVSNGNIYTIGGYNGTAATAAVSEAIFNPNTFLTNLDPAEVWVGLKNSDDVGIKFDLMAEVYKNAELIGSGQLDSVAGGSSGFNNAHLNTIPLTLTGPVELFPTSNTLTTKVYVRNACTGSGKNAGTSRFWYNDVAANSHFGATVANSPLAYYFGNNSVLLTSVGTGPRRKIDTAAGSKCSAFKLIGSWSKSL